MSECTVNRHFVVVGGREGGRVVLLVVCSTTGIMLPVLLHTVGGMKLYLVVYSLSLDLLPNDSVILAN